MKPVTPGVFRSSYQVSSSSIHANQHVPREDLLRHLVPLPLLDFDFFLGGNHDFENTIAHIPGLDLAFDGFLDLVFVAGIGVQHVPVPLGPLRPAHPFRPRA